MDEHNWSDWYPYSLSQDFFRNIPEAPGIYEVRTDYEFGRLKGSSPLLTIGSAAKSLKTRISRQRIGNTIRYLNRPEKWIRRAKHVLEFRYYECSNKDEAKYLEAIRQLEYENQHWELPPGNDRLDLSPVKKRIKALLGISMEQLVADLHQGKLEVSEVVEKTHISPAIINNFIVYWGNNDA